MSKKEKKNKKNSQKNPPTNWTTMETRGFLLFSFAFLLFISLISYATDPDSKNLLGLFGHTVGWSFHALIGLSSYILAFYFGWIGWRMLFSKPIEDSFLKHFYIGLVVFSSSILLSLFEEGWPSTARSLQYAVYPGLMAKKLHYHLGGAPFYYLYNDLPVLSIHHLFNRLGAGLVFSTLLVSSLIFLFKVRLIDLFLLFTNRLKNQIAAATEKKEEEPPRPSFLQTKKNTPAEEKNVPFKGQENTESDFMRFVKLRIPTSSLEEPAKSNQSKENLLAIHPEKNLTVRPSLSRKEESDLQPSFSTPFLGEEKEATKAPENLVKQTKKEAAIAAQRVFNGDFSSYIIPSPNLLTSPKKIDQTSIKKDLKKQAEVLEETLLSFGIEAKVGQINCGPTITSFEVQPAIGVKVQKIKALSNDIALNMEAKSIRIIAPIPGKAVVGIEVPNQQPQEVSFKEMLQAYQQGPQKFHIPILLGKAVNGDYVTSDLAKMPHCIIAGATGSGKSVCINTIVMSIVLNAKPDEVRLVMVDPKKVELTPYTALPHMLAPVITEPQGASAALNWLVKEMENRYEILKLIGVRNIDAFNNRNINQEVEASLNREIPEKMPFIVGIIDELADLMMVASQDIETPIARIAQMARAVGIHLILATQRPSREVITGLIKANFPTRISFKVASRVNSQIVLDEIGAEELLGNGDMLFLPPGSSHLVRAQGAFIRDEDIAAVVKFVCDQAPPRYVIESFDRFHDFKEGSGESSDGEDLDSLFHEAKAIILSTGNASTTFLQRKLKIGYARAASLMDQLELNGVVGPAEGSKPRKIFGRKEETVESEVDGF